MEREGDESGNVFGPSSIQGSPTSSKVRDEEDLNDHHQDDERHNQEHQQPGVTYGLNALGSNVVLTSVREDFWSCLVLLSTFWFFASMAVIFAFSGSENIQLVPNSSLLIQANRFFFQSIKAQEISESKHGPMLYGFNEPPPLDVKITWSETHNALIESSHHKAKFLKLPLYLFPHLYFQLSITLQEWQYFLNKRSKVKISYSVESPSSAPFSLIIPKGRKSLLEWIEDPSYPDTTLSWNIAYGNEELAFVEMVRSNRKFSSLTHFIALGNLNAEEVEVQLNFTYEAFSFSGRCCCPIHSWSRTGYDQLCLVCQTVLWYSMDHIFCCIRCDVREMDLDFKPGTWNPNGVPLLSPKDDNLSSWGSSYDSILHDEELNEWIGVASPDRKQQKEGESAKNPQRICVICFDASRDCFFLPCGHCATCFTCGTRVMEEAGTCPICHRMMKKERKIFTV
ncbi:unnamed protein product [Ilex paraguariensis]|uniref:RING-type domain-containing protein n=1 Tax=Ilex paraguariensis TaxID=185542 RepID=A0ABC8R0A4_9AQUA